MVSCDKENHFLLFCFCNVLQSCVYNKYFSLCSYFKILRFIHSNFPCFSCKASKRCLKQDMQSKIKHASYWLCLQLLRGQLLATLVWRNPCYEKRNWKKAEIKASSFVWASHGNIYVFLKKTLKVQSLSYFPWPNSVISCLVLYEL